MCSIGGMTDLMEKALAAVRSWPAEQQNEAAGVLLALDQLGSTAYAASTGELLAIDEGSAQAARGEFATEAEFERAFARLRK